METGRRILVIANETAAGRAIVDEVRYRGGDAPEVLVVAPVLAASRIQHWLGSQSDEARDEALARQEASVAALVAAGCRADGRLGDGDPLQALDDAICVFHPHEIVISTHPPARSTWLERRVVQRARERYRLPIHHVVVDTVLEAERIDRDRRPGPQAPRATVTLYRSTDYDETLAVNDRGFINQSHGGRSGLPFSTSPGAEVDATVFEVEIPEDLLGAYEVEGGPGGERRFIVPADLVNRHQPRVSATDWAE